MNNKFDRVAFLAALAATLLASFIAASIYQLRLEEIFQSGFWGAPVYFFIFFGFIGYPVYVWVRYFRRKRKRGTKPSTGYRH